MCVHILKYVCRGQRTEKKGERETETERDRETESRNVDFHGKELTHGIMEARELEGQAGRVGILVGFLCLSPSQKVTLT